MDRVMISWSITLYFLRATTCMTHHQPDHTQKVVVSHTGGVQGKRAAVSTSNNAATSFPPGGNALTDNRRRWGSGFGRVARTPETCVAFKLGNNPF